MFNRDLLKSADKIILELLRHYQTFFIWKIPILPEHKAAKVAVEDVISSKLWSIGIYKALHITASATRYRDDNAKQPDCQYSPIRPPQGRAKRWLTVALEIAVSEISSKLMSDVRWWLRQLNGATEAVLILKVDHNIPKITLEKMDQRWEWASSQRNFNNCPERCQQYYKYRQRAPYNWFRADGFTLPDHAKGDGCGI